MLCNRTNFLARQAYGQGSFRWPGDFNRDGDVDDLDYDEIKAAVQQGYALGDAGYEPDLDLDRDGKITDDDFTLFDACTASPRPGWGSSATPPGPTAASATPGTSSTPRR